MNNKEARVYQIIDIVIRCCAYKGKEEELRQKVMDGCKDDNTVLTRYMIARLMAFAGYSNESIALILDKEERTVRLMLASARDCRLTRPAYRIAEDEAVKLYAALDEESA